MSAHFQSVFAASQFSSHYTGAAGDASFGKPVTTSVLPNIALSHMSVFECSVCQRRFASKKYLSMHAALHKMASVTGNNPAAAAEDDVNINRPAQFRSTATPGGRHGNGGPVQSWSCPVCGKTFAQNSNFRNHVRTHSDERPYVCLVCFIGFKERYHLKKHALFKHSGELKEQCRQCGKRFKDLTAVRAHERTHSDLRPYQCDRCNKTFKTSECLWHHENRSKTCGRSPNEIATGGRRRHLANAGSASWSRDRRSNASEDRGVVSAKAADKRSTTLYSSSPPIKNEATMSGFENSIHDIHDIDLDLTLDDDLGQFNPYNGSTGGLQWAVATSHFDGRLRDDQLSTFRHSPAAATTPSPVTDCLVTSDNHSFTSGDCDVAEFPMNCDDTMTSLNKRTTVDGIGDYGVDEYDVKSFYDVVDADADSDTSASVAVHDFRFAPPGNPCHVTHHVTDHVTHHDCLLDTHAKSLALQTCTNTGYRDVVVSDMNRPSMNSFGERNNGHHQHVAMTSSWCSSSVPTAIVAPMQRLENPLQRPQHHGHPQNVDHFHHYHHRQQQQQQQQPPPPPPQQQQQQRSSPEASTSSGTEKCLLPPFETFVPPRRTRIVPAAAAGHCCKTQRGRPQQQFPTVTRYLLQSTGQQSYGSRLPGHCRTSGVQVERVNSHSIQHDGHLTAVDGLSAVL